MKTHRHSWSAAWLLGCLLSSTTFAAEPMIQRIDFQAEASEIMVNDELNATFYVEADDRSAFALSKQLNTITQQALAHGKGYPSVKLASGNIQQWPLHDKKNQISHWRGRAEIELRATDLEAASKLMATLQKTLQLQGVRFNVSDKRQDEVEAQLTTRAIAAFKQRAEQIKKAWGAKSYELVQMSLGRAGSYQPMPRAVMAMAMKAGSEDSMATPEFASGESTLRVQANGSIRLAF